MAANTHGRRKRGGGGGEAGGMVHPPFSQLVVLESLRFLQSPSVLRQTIRLVEGSPNLQYKYCRHIDYIDRFNFLKIRLNVACPLPHFWCRSYANATTCVHCELCRQGSGKSWLIERRSIRRYLTPLALRPFLAGCQPDRPPQE